MHTYSRHQYQLRQQVERLANRIRRGLKYEGSPDGGCNNNIWRTYFHPLIKRKPATDLCLAIHEPVDCANCGIEEEDVTGDEPLVYFVDEDGGWSQETDEETALMGFCRWLAKRAIERGYTQRFYARDS